MLLIVHDYLMENEVSLSSKNQNNTLQITKQKPAD